MKRKLAIAALTALASSGIVVASSATPAQAAVTCTTHKGKTAGWIHCTGSGTVRLIIDCKAPQVTDYVSQWVTYSGRLTLSGECNFGINHTTYQAR